MESSCLLVNWLIVDSSSSSTDGYMYGIGVTRSKS